MKRIFMCRFHQTARSSSQYTLAAYPVCQHTRRTPVAPASSRDFAQITTGTACGSVEQNAARLRACAVAGSVVCASLSCTLSTQSF